MPVSQVTKAGQGPHQMPSSRQSCWTPSMVASGPVRSGNTANPLRRSSSVAGASSGSALNPSVRRSNSDTTWPRPSESTSNTQHPTSNTQHPTSNIQHPTSNIQHPTSNTQHPTSNIQHPTSNTQHPTPNIQHPTSNTQHPTPNIQHPTSNTQHPKRKVAKADKPFRGKAESRKAGPSHPRATPRPVDSQPIATHKPPPCDLHATQKPPQSANKATFQPGDTEGRASVTPGARRVTYGSLASVLSRRNGVS